MLCSIRSIDLSREKFILVWVARIPWFALKFRRY